MRVCASTPLEWDKEEVDWVHHNVFGYCRLVEGSSRAQQLHREWSPRHADQRALCESLYWLDHPPHHGPDEQEALDNWDAMHLFEITLGNSELGEGYEHIMQRVLSLKLDIPRAANEAEEADMSEEMDELLDELFAEPTDTMKDWAMVNL